MWVCKKHTRNAFYALVHAWRWLGIINACPTCRHLLSISALNGRIYVQANAAVIQRGVDKNRQDDLHRGISREMSASAKLFVLLR